MEDEWRFLCVIRGYHVYKDVWDPYLGDGFTTKHDRNNPHDMYTVVVLSVDAKNKRTVGHLPRRYPRSAASSFSMEVRSRCGSPLVGLPQRTYRVGCLALASW